MKNIMFVTGTRADFGKLKPLIKELDMSSKFNVTVFITGMHLLKKYGYTYNEILKEKFSNVFTYFNQNTNTSKMMDLVLAETIKGLSLYVSEHDIDMIVVHGDRVETLASAIVGSLNDILVAHIEGGERTGTIDDLIRHSVTKLSHLHFVCSDDNKKRLIQMGEKSSSIYVIGSPDIDIMLGDSLPTLDYVKKHYEIEFDRYAIVMYHPVTTEIDKINKHSIEIIEAIKYMQNKNFIVILPNNDKGSDIIIKNYEELKTLKNVKIFPSIRFESFLTLLKNSDFIVGNSSCGIHEAPVYGIPTINLGSRQKNRFYSESIININENKQEIISAINSINGKYEPIYKYGTGKSAKLFSEILLDERIWDTSVQKEFIDLDL